MSTKITTPSNRNLLGNFNHQLVFSRIPGVAFFCQAVEVPGISVGEAFQPTPFKDILRPGDKVIFEPLPITFKVDEDMANFKEIWNWIVGLGFPKEFEQYKTLKNGGLTTAFAKSDRNVVSDGTLIVTTNKKNENLKVKFTDLWPSTLSSLKFNTDANDVEYLTADATFNYTLYEFV